MQARADAARLCAAEATVRVAGRAHEAADGDAQLGKRVDGLAARHDTKVDELTRCWEARHTAEDEAQSLLLSGEELREGARRADSEVAAEREETKGQLTARRSRGELVEERTRREERGAAMATAGEGLARTDAGLRQTLQIVHRALPERQDSCGLKAVQVRDGLLPVRPTTVTGLPFRMLHHAACGLCTEAKAGIGWLLVPMRAQRARAPHRVSG